MEVKIIAPDRIVLQSEAEELLVVTEGGQMGILNHHAPLIGTLKDGKIKVKASGVWTDYPGGKGLLEVQGNKVLILLDA